MVQGLGFRVEGVVCHGVTLLFPVAFFGMIGEEEAEATKRFSGNPHLSFSWTLNPAGTEPL